MARVRLTENKLRQIIRESVQNILNEDSMMWNPGVENTRPAPTGKGPATYDNYVAPTPRPKSSGRAPVSPSNYPTYGPGQNTTPVTKEQSLMNRLKSLYSQLGIDIKKAERFGGDYDQKAQFIIADLRKKAEMLEKAQSDLAAANDKIGRLNGTIQKLKNENEMLKMRVSNSQNSIRMPQNDLAARGPQLSAPQNNRLA